MPDGVTTTYLPPSATVREIMGNSDAGTVRIPVELLAAIIAQSIPGPNLTTYAELAADLNWDEPAQGAVWGDANTALNGVYKKSGVSGTGAWTRIGDLPMSAATLSALAAKAPLASPALTGVPTAPTAAPGTATTQLATTQFIADALSNLLAASPGTLDTLNELAAALGDDPNFAATVSANLAAKAPLASPALTGVPTAPTAAPGTTTTQVATTAFVDAVRAELAAALGDDPNFATTVTNALAQKSPLDSPAFTGAPTAPTAAPGTATAQVASTAFVDAIRAAQAAALTAVTGKTDHLTVTAPTDLDAIRLRVADLDSAVILRGDWDASLGVFPNAGAAQRGAAWVVSAQGVVDGVFFGVGDWVVAEADNASPTAYAGNWRRMDHSNAVSSVAGRTGAIALTKSDVGLNNVDNTPDAAKPVSTAQRAEFDGIAVHLGQVYAGLSQNEVMAPDFWGHEADDVSVALTVDGAPVALFDVGGAPVTPVLTDFHGETDGEAVHLTLDGAPFMSLDGATGEPLTPVWTDFYGETDSDQTVDLAIDGRSVVRLDGSGQLTAHITAAALGLGNVDDTPDLDKPVSAAARAEFDDLRRVPLVPYLDGGDLHTVSDADVVVADLTGRTVSALHPGTHQHVLAVIDRPELSAQSAVAAGPLLPGELVPATDTVLHCFLTLGQSNGLGRYGSVNIVSTDPEFPEVALMLNRIDGTEDVRLGVPSQVPVAALTGAEFDGFTDLRAVVAGGSGPTGQTPLESFAYQTARAAQQLGIPFRSLSICTAVGGQEYDEIDEGEQNYTNMLVALTKAAELAQERGWRLVVSAAICKHGEQDNVIGNVDYLADLIEWQSDVDRDVKLITGQAQDVHFYLHQPASHQGAAPATLAMLEAHNTRPNIHLAGADYPFAAAYHTDYLHMTGPGYYWIGEMMARAYRHIAWGNRAKPAIVQITAAARTGTSVVIDYEVPVPPLVFDTATISERDVRGFRFFDSAGQVAITDAAITGPAQVTLTLATVPSGVGERIEYATTPQGGTRSAANVCRGNLRDSSPLISNHDNRNLWNWAVIQSWTL